MVDMLSVGGLKSVCAYFPAALCEMMYMYEHESKTISIGL